MRGKINVIAKLLNINCPRRLALVPRISTPHDQTTEPHHSVMD